MLTEADAKMLQKCASIVCWPVWRGERRAIVGLVLVRAKTLVPPGKWGAWVRSHCGFSHKTAAQYMQLWHAMRVRKIASQPVFRPLETRRMLDEHIDALVKEVADLFRDLQTATIPS